MDLGGALLGLGYVSAQFRCDDAKVESVIANRMNSLRRAFQVCFGVIGICILSRRAAGQIRYHVTNIESIIGFRAGVVAINDAGQFAGNYSAKIGLTRSFFYDGIKTVDLGSFDSGGQIGATALNNAGQIVGGATLADFEGRGFSFYNGVLSEIGASFGPVAINDGGQIVGTGHRLPGVQGILLKAGNAMELGSLGGAWTFPADINNLGQVVGYSYVVDFTPPHAFLYSDGQMIDLGTAGGKGSAATAINDRGEIVGYIDYPNAVRHAMRYADGKMTDLGTLGGSMARALAINNAGVVVGTSYSTPVGGIHAFIYRDGVMLDLNALADLASAGVEVLNEAIAVNNRGQILCDGLYLLDPIPGSSRLTNFSIRAEAGRGEQTMLMGFVVRGGSKSALLRAAGPALASFGVPRTVADPRITLFEGAVAMAGNDDWYELPEAANVVAVMRQVGAFGLPERSKDAALVSLVPAGAYTAHVMSSGEVGSALGEIYDADADSAGGSIFANASARAYIGGGDQNPIAGFVIRGDVPKTVLIRAVGPTLANFGVNAPVANPQLTIFAEGRVIATNDDWNTANNASVIASVTERVGAFMLSPASKDAAVFATLNPGAYSVQASGVHGSTGVVLIEVYDVL